MEKIRKNERAENWICRYWLQIKSCRECLFDALCSYQDQNDENKRKNLWENGRDNKENSVAWE